MSQEFDSVAEAYDSWYDSPSGRVVSPPSAAATWPPGPGHSNPGLKWR